MPEIAVTSKNVLQAGTKYPITGIMATPTAHNMLEPLAIHTRYFSVVNSRSMTKLVQFLSPVKVLTSVCVSYNLTTKSGSSFIHKPDVHQHTHMNKILLSLFRCAFRDSDDFKVAQITSLSLIYI